MRRTLFASLAATLLLCGAFAVHAHRTAELDVAADDALVPPLVMVHAGLRLLP